MMRGAAELGLLACGTCGLVSRAPAAPGAACPRCRTRLASRARPAGRARLYRLIESIGRWWMLDIFVVALLVALVQLTALAAVRAGPAAPAFGAVVVLTMAAAQSFDPRLIWDDARSA